MNDQDRPCEDRPTLVQKLRRFSLQNWLYHALSEDWCGNDSVPLDHRTLRVQEKDGCEYVFCILNDAFEVGIGYPNKWHGLYRREVFHRMIFWYLRQWIFGEWLGIRRWIWYKLLHARCKRHSAVGKV